MQIGQHVQMLTMPEDVDQDDRVEPGTKGEVVKLHPVNEDGSQTVRVRWEDGRTTDLAIPPDRVQTIGDDE